MKRDQIVPLVGEATDHIASKLVGWRRDLHRYPESGWTEFRTASLVARHLVTLGYQTNVGQAALQSEARMGVPPPETLEAHRRRAAEQGGDPEFLDLMRGGHTAVVGTLQQGEGPTIGIRFDMDALQIAESTEETHRPAREGFASRNPGVSHACAHDGHTAIGMGIASVLHELRRALQGRVVLIFQPAEEGVRGAKAMVEAGVVDEVDYLLGFHLFSGWAKGEIVGGMAGGTATEKFDATFRGQAAHAGGSPHKGRNALLAAATAVINLYAIPRHAGGTTRINVGWLKAGSDRNIIPSQAHLAIETRGATAELNRYMARRARQILEAAAAMYDCHLEIRLVGAAPTVDSDPALAARAETVARTMGQVTTLPPTKGGGSEDLTAMMKRVQERGGLATRIGIGADLYGIGRDKEREDERLLAAHTPHFDFEEEALPFAVQLLSSLALDLMHRPLD